MQNKNIKKKRSKFVSTFIILSILAGIGLIAGFIGLTWYNDVIYTPSQDQGEVEYRVNEGDSLTNIADDLEEKGIIRSKDALRLYLRLNSLTANIKTGDYLLKKNLTVPQLIEIFEDGVFKPAVWVTVKEGLWNEDIAEIINSALNNAGSKKNFNYSEFLQIIDNPDKYTFSEEITSFLSKAKPAGKPLTGYLFPDTYRINADATSLEVIEMMLTNLQTRLGDNQINPDPLFWDKSKLRNFYETLILASILEKEAGRDDDISLISGVFHNRLAQNYPLQSDATVNFATGKNERGASLEDLEISSPYNTYRNAGLPPTPINNPGIRSIKAAIEPATTNYFFFWHSSENKVYFAVTYDEHQRNIIRYP